jgi:hypothetical protein
MSIRFSIGIAVGPNKFDAMYTGGITSDKTTAVVWCKQLLSRR